MINVNLIKGIHPTLMNYPFAELFPLLVINWLCEKRRPEAEESKRLKILKAAVIKASVIPKTSQQLMCKDEINRTVQKEKKASVKQGSLNQEEWQSCCNQLP